MNDSDIIAAAHQCSAQNNGDPISLRDVYYQLVPPHHKKQTWGGRKPLSMKQIERALTSDGYEAVGGRGAILYAKRK